MRIRDNKEIGKYRILNPSMFRKLTMDSFEFIPPSPNMIGLLEFDITTKKQIIADLQKKGKKVSLFASILKSIATALSAYPQLNSIRNHYRIIQFEDIDINIPLEIETQEGRIPRQVVIRNANQKTMEEIYSEIHSAKQEYEATGHTGSEDKWAMRIMKILFFVPRFIRKWILRSIAKNPFMIKKQSGTTFITSVSKFISGSGFIIPYLSSSRAVSFAVGSESDKFLIYNGKNVERTVISITIIFNHDIIDGAEAARFTNHLKQLIESS